MFSPMPEGSLGQNGLPLLKSPPPPPIEILFVGPLRGHVDNFRRKKRTGAMNLLLVHGPGDCLLWLGCLTLGRGWTTPVPALPPIAPRSVKHPKISLYFLYTKNTPKNNFGQAQSAGRLFFIKVPTCSMVSTRAPRSLPSRAETMEPSPCSKVRAASRPPGLFRARSA